MIAASIALAAALAVAQTETSTAAEVIPEPPAEAPEYTIHVRGRRLAEPARADTSVRLTGEELAERGVTNLAQAMDLVTDTNVRPQGRGGYQVNIRGARKGAVLILIDGVPMSDVYNGNFDLTSVATTDIAEIRVSLTPASPLDGPGGNGGVIEVRTRAATGPAEARLESQASDAPSGHAAISARGGLPGDVYLRLSGGGNLSNRELAAVMPDRTPGSVDENMRSMNGGLRLERKFGSTQTSLTLSAARRRFTVPPLELERALVTDVEREDLFRGTAGFATRFDGWNLSANVFSLVLDRKERAFADATLTTKRSETELDARRFGANVQADFLAGDSLRLTFAGHVTYESADSVLQTPAQRQANAGSVGTAEPAAGVTWSILDALTLDASAGLAIPIGADAAPWPEAKLWLTYAPVDEVEVKLVGARKGRVPVLRERYEIGSGNVSIDPEMGTAAELAVRVDPLAWLSTSASAYWRLTEGLIRLDEATRSMLDNVGDVTISGFELRADAFKREWISFGAAYAFARATSDQLGEDPLDFFPGHRAETWISARYERDVGTWLRVKYNGERSDNGTVLYDYVTVDGSLWWTFDKVRLSARADNLFDQRYQQRFNVPGYGRTLYLGIEGVLD